MWWTSGLSVKGNNHTVERNTIFWSGVGNQAGGIDDEGSNIYDITMYNEFIEGTCNCLAGGPGNTYCPSQPDVCCVTGDDGTFEGRQNTIKMNAMESFKGLQGGGTASPSTSNVDNGFGDGSYAYPGIAGNSAGYLFDELRDPANWDFRPKTGSNFVTSAIGAYEISDPTKYWIPGRREYRASMPVPPSGNTGVKMDADLMWLAGMTDLAVPTSHRAYAACSEANLAAMTTPTCTLTGEWNNVCTPPSSLMRRGRTVYWRVDTFMSDGSVYPGEVWNFTVEEFGPPAAEPPPICTKWESRETNSFPSGSNNFNLDEIDISADYADASWTFVNVTICIVDADYSTGFEELQLRVLNPAVSGPHVRMTQQQGNVGTHMRDACFTDTATNKVTTTDPCEMPFTGTWLPFNGYTPSGTTLNDLVTSTNLGTTAGKIRIGAICHGCAGTKAVDLHATSSVGCWIKSGWW